MAIGRPGDVMVGRRRLDSGYGTMHGLDREGRPMMQTDDGRRFVRDTVDVGGAGVAVDVPTARQPAARFEPFQDSGTGYGSRELRDGEYEVLVPGPQGVRIGVQAPVDMNGDGIPDGAEIVRTKKSFEGGADVTERITFRKGQGGGGSGAFSALDLSGAATYRNMESIGAERHESNLGRLREAKLAGSRDSGRLGEERRIQFNEAGGLAGERQHRERLAIGPAEAEARGQVGAAREEARGVVGAAQATAGAEKFKFKQAQLERLAEQKIRVFNTSDGGQAIFHGGKMMNVAPNESQARPGHVELREDPTEDGKPGKLIGFVTPNGDIEMIGQGKPASGGAGAGDIGAKFDKEFESFPLR